MAAEHGNEDWALCVGIGDYSEAPGLDDLPGALNDARRFYDWVSDPNGGGVPRRQRRLILSPDSRKRSRPGPTEKDIEVFFDQIVGSALAKIKSGKGVTIGRRLYIYLAGHGLSLGKDGTTALLTGDTAFPVTYRHFAGPLWADFMRDSGFFQEIFLVMDCCRLIVRGVEPKSPHYRQVSAGKPALHFYAKASTDGAVAREIEIDGQSCGVFTDKLLGLLKSHGLGEQPLKVRDLNDLLYQELSTSNEPELEFPLNPYQNFTVLAPRVLSQDPTVEYSSPESVEPEAFASVEIETSPSREWLHRVASMSWSGAELSEIDPSASEPISTDFDSIAAALGIPVEAMRRLLYKAPPIGRLVDHDVVAFVGASNDQLPVALKIAFAGRNGRKWKRLEFFFLDDEKLGEMTSDSRSGPSLRQARDSAQEELECLCPMLAEQWQLSRYDGLLIDDLWHFASLWDWAERGGFVHVSPYSNDEDVRYMMSVDEEWPADQARPPEVYEACVRAYEELTSTARPIKSSE